jgi:uncharacterized membrane protein YobD (UPF0266 family)
MSPLILRFVPGDNIRIDGFYLSGHIGFYPTFATGMFMAESYMFSYPEIKELAIIVDDDYMVIETDADRIMAKLKYG